MSSAAEHSTKTTDLNLVVNDLLQQMQSRFDSVGRTIETRLVDMDQRMSELETSIQELMEQAGLQGATPKNGNTSNFNNGSSSSSSRAQI